MLKVGADPSLLNLPQEMGVFHTDRVGASNLGADVLAQHMDMPVRCLAVNMHALMGAQRTSCAWCKLTGVPFSHFAEISHALVLPRSVNETAPSADADTMQAW